ncbi:MAG: DUF115 domain-containing protein [Spirochaetaceae bacterium]|jgi:hypothetical protein|nr:DUF115 domain-containing protein [Spirochaetaceae bacterium]
MRQVFGALPDVLPRNLPPEIEIAATPSGVPSLRVSGALIHSAKDPLREAQRIVKTEYEHSGGCTAGVQKAGEGGGEGKAPFFILLGFGLGYGALAAAEMFPGSFMLIIEKRAEVLRAALEQRDWTGFLTGNRLIFVLGGESAAVFSALNAAVQGGADASSVVVIKNRALMRFDSPWYGEIEAHIATWRQKNRVNTATLERFGERWRRNLQANSAAIHELPGVSQLWGGLHPAATAPAGSGGTGEEADGGFPLLLLAAGPSLDEIAPHIGALRDRFVIVAVDTAARFLFHSKTEADFMLSVDAQYWNSRHLDYIHDSAKTVFIFDPVVHPPLLRRLSSGRAGRVFLCAPSVQSGLDSGTEALSKGRLAAGGTVASSAWDFCRLMTGRGEIWIAGLDLAYPALKTHYKGALFEERALSASCRFRPAELAVYMASRALPVFLQPAMDGSLVYTDTRLHLYKRWFAAAFERHPDIRCYALTAQGLAIAGLQPASLERALAKKIIRPAIDAALQAMLTRAS